MAVNQTSVTTGGNVKNYQGLSTDTKPTNCGGGSSFLELNTGKIFVFDEVNINPATTNGWWEI